MLRPETNIPEGTDLQKAAIELQAAATKYRDAYKAAFGIAEAVIWLKCEHFTVTFTRGEHQQALMDFIKELP